MGLAVPPNYHATSTTSTESWQSAFPTQWPPWSHNGTCVLYFPWLHSDACDLKFIETRAAMHRVTIWPGFGNWSQFTFPASPGAGVSANCKCLYIYIGVHAQHPLTLWWRRWRSDRPTAPAITYRSVMMIDCSCCVVVIVKKLIHAFLIWTHTELCGLGVSSRWRVSVW